MHYKKISNLTFQALVFCQSKSAIHFIFCCQSIHYHKREMMENKLIFYCSTHLKFSTTVIWHVRQHNFLLQELLLFDSLSFVLFIMGSYLFSVLPIKFFFLIIIFFNSALLDCFIVYVQFQSDLIIIYGRDLGRNSRPHRP